MTVRAIMCACMYAGAAGMILLDNEPNGFRVTTKGPPFVNLTLATVPQVRVQATCCLDLLFSSSTHGCPVDAPACCCRENNLRLCSRYIVTSQAWQLHSLQNVMRPELDHRQSIHRAGHRSEAGGEGACRPCCNHHLQQRQAGERCQPL